MAKRTAARSSQSITRIIRAPAPIVRVSAPRAAPKSKGRKGHHRGKGGKDGLIACAVAGGVLGYLDKNSTNFPTVPMLGRAGTLAVVCHYWKSNIMGFSTADLAKGFAAIAAYEYTTKGSVSGPGW